MALSITVKNFVLLPRIINPGVLGTYLLGNSVNPQVRHYAARKGTREKARKKKAAIDAQKAASFVPKEFRKLSKDELKMQMKRWVETHEEDHIDDVFMMRRFKTLKHSIIDAAQFHRENLHPTICDQPDSPLELRIELDMTAEKKTRFMDKFRSLIQMPHPIYSGPEKKILVFCKTIEIAELAKESGANHVGDVALIKQVENGTFNVAEFDTILCHPNIVIEMSAIRSLLKRKFPNIKDGTLGINLKDMIHRYKYGLEISCITFESVRDFGVIKTPFANLKMTNEEIEENFKAIIKDVNKRRPKREGDFITTVFCSSPLSNEKFLIDYEKYIEEEPVQATKESKIQKEDEAEEKEKKEARA